MLPKNVYALILYFLKPYKYAAIIFLLLASFAGFWGTLNNQIIKYIIDLLPQASGGNIEILFFPAFLLVLNFIIFDNVTWRSMSYLVYKYLPQIQNDITSTLFYYVTGLSHQYFQDNLTGRTSSQINTLTYSLTQLFYPIISNFIRGGSLLLIALISTFYVNPIFSWIIIGWLICFVTFSAYMSRGIVAYADKSAATETEVEGQLVDSISNNNNIRLFSKRQFELSWLYKFLNKRMDAFRQEERYILIMNTVQGLLIALMLGLSVFFLVKLYGQQQVTTGDFALILGIAMEVGHMTWFTMYSYDEFNKALGRCKQSIEYLIVPQEIQDAENATDLRVDKGKIKFESVKFHYKGVTPLFENISIEIQGGQKVGLVGYSGSGKTTFINLILRLYNVNNGRILIDGQDISMVTQESLRSQIAMIPQDPSLFHRSIMDNIRYGRIDASDEEVIQAAKKAHAHEFIIKLSDGYNSLVGERGVRLSGGQRQRIAIARAILKDAPILVLDEATSQLDSVTEKLIQESLWELIGVSSTQYESEDSELSNNWGGGADWLPKSEIPAATNVRNNKTVLVIAHRLSTLLYMDRILVFDKGKIVEDGSHKELLKKGGLYKTLWDAQVGGFIGDAASIKED